MLNAVENLVFYLESQKSGVRNNGLPYVFFGAVDFYVSLSESEPRSLNNEEKQKGQGNHNF